MLKIFRIISLIEGLSLIILLFVAMPMRYYMGNMEIVPICGMSHGLLWTLYMLASLAVSHQKEWSVTYWLFTVLLSIVPGGFLLMEKQLSAMENVKPVV